MSENETIADIVAELQRCGDKWIDDKAKTTMECLGLIAIQFARRIEAAWKRERAEVEAARTAEKSSVVGNADPKFDLCRDVESVLRIGRGFQKQDPWCGAHYDTAKLLCDTIEYLRNRLNVPVGNAAAMRKALEFLRDKELDLLEGNVRRCVGLTVFGLEQVCKIMRGVIEEALSAPPRNCDRHGGWLTALKRFNDTDGRDNPWGDDVFDSSFLDWLFAPATEGGAK